MAPLTTLIILLAASIVVGAATASISRLIARERGPFNVIGRIVQRITNSIPDTIPSYGESLTWRQEVSQLLTCPICSGVYLSTLLTLILVAALGLPFLFALLIAPAGLGISYALLGLGAMWQ